ncbi:hypothetical protein M9194_05785 [Vibrio sp. S4M6]|uniref:hypothetical protein n=1 Tax=Vibrio sinus TaxID=2946865 RepID=UPI00202A5823|nr:hypothetical protein [Vibrio sinus]MCL9780941.1 hypothetical protein [Vibrio sinus]
MSDEKSNEFPGISISTSDGIDFKSSEWCAITVGNKDDWVIGNYFSVAGPFTNKIYGGEYVQYYPGQKIDIHYWTHKFHGWQGVYTAAKDAYYMNKLEAIQENVNVTATAFNACNAELSTIAETVRTSQNEINFRTLYTQVGQINTEKNELSTRANGLNVEKNKIVSKLSETQLNKSTAMLNSINTQITSVTGVIMLG